MPRLRHAFVAMASFAFVMAFTPGPNNIMLTASGVNFGFARTMPHMVGRRGRLCRPAVRGLGAGLGALIAAFPAIQTVLKVVGAAYMLWLAWKVANARHGRASEGGDGQPLTFLQAAAFQWVNPKGAGHRAQRGRDLRAAGARAVSDFAVMLAVFARRDAGFGRDLGRLRRRRCARLLRKRAPRPHFQHRHGAAAGRQHRADGALTPDGRLSSPTGALVGRARAS